MRSIIAIGLLTLLTSCGSGHHVEQERVNSPDGHVDAVYVTQSIGGGFGHISREIHILPTGAPAPAKDHKDAYLVIDSGKLLEMRWVGERLLEVRYEAKASISKFKNTYFRPLNGKVFDNEYELVLVRVPGPDQSSAD